MTGARLILVGTPIGNLGDISPRALEALSSAMVVACEDTRRTGRLLSHFGIASPTYIVVNEHTEAEAATRIIERLRNDERVVLVSDAGMPAISDPGELLVQRVIEAGLGVEAIPGPSAALHALVVSGLVTSRFVVEGFIPRKGSTRSVRLSEIADEQRTVVIYEAPHRLLRTLGDLLDACGSDRRVAIARELTKIHEEVWRGTLGGAVNHWEETAPRGEFVLVLAGSPPPEAAGDDAIVSALERARGAGVSTRDAIDEVARELSVPRNRVYRVATGSAGGAGE